MLAQGPHQQNPALYITYTYILIQVLAMASGKLPAITDPRGLDWIHKGHVTSRYLRRLSSFSPAAARRRLNSYYKFVFVRHPLDRLVSAFREKFTVNARYVRLLGPRIIRRSAEYASPRR